MKALADVFIVTAGPTREHLDPVRFLSNPSTGKMGFAIARAAVEAGYRTFLVAGPVRQRTPMGVERVDVVSACEMLGACQSCLEASRGAARVFLVSAAAIADWRPATCASQKLKKKTMTGVLKLVRNPDLLKTLGAALRREQRKEVRLIGFAAETGEPTQEAVRKCREKCLAMIVANNVLQKGCGFGTSTNTVQFLWPDGRCEKLPSLSKLAVARRLVRACQNLPCD